MKCRFNTLCIRAVSVALVFHLGACSQHASETGLTSESGHASDREMSAEAMRTLRVNAWRLLAPFAMRSEGLPLPNGWKPRHQLMPLNEGMQSSGVATLRRAVEQESPSHGELPLYEMTFFNDIASEYIEKEALRVRGTTDALMAAQRREIEFPRDSVAVKMFWLHMDREKIEVRKWDWNAIGTRERLPKDLLETRCVTRESVDGCVKATDAFYTIRVRNPDDFSCPSDAPCPQLKEDDVLLLVALHIASKQMPEWLWATFWWRDADARSGEFWTCDDAQREEALNRVEPPWSNYSMDVTASFTMAKPRRPEKAADAACGIPGEIGEGEQLRAAYNPFVEAFLPRGLKSSCIDCHSRASTNQIVSSRTTVPRVGDPAGPAFRDFEGHLRLDYMWSLWNGLKGTQFPRDDWPLQRE